MKQDQTSADYYEGLAFSRLITYSFNRDGHAKNLPGVNLTDKRGSLIATSSVVSQLAATDSSSQELSARYIAGADAQGILGAKAQMSEADFAAMIQKNFGV